MKVKILVEAYYEVPGGIFRLALRSDPPVLPATLLMLPEAIENRDYFKREVGRYSRSIKNSVGQSTVVDTGAAIDRKAWETFGVPYAMPTHKSQWQKDVLSPVWTPTKTMDDVLDPIFNAMLYGTGFKFMVPNPINFSLGSLDPLEFPESPPEPEFETNLTEALVGWKAWKTFGLPAALISANGTQWRPLQQVKANCHAHHYTYGRAKKPKGCPLSPTANCSCGIYAVDDVGGVPDVGDHAVIGEVYGWGRYVRGNDGWRAQFAYPKSFLLNEDQAKNEMLLSSLLEFRVPISVIQPVKIYDPGDDGYENGQNDTCWDLGTDSQPDTAEDESAGAEEA